MKYLIILLLAISFYGCMDDNYYNHCFRYYYYCYDGVVSTCVDDELIMHETACSYESGSTDELECYKISPECNGDYNVTCCYGESKTYNNKGNETECQ